MDTPNENAKISKTTGKVMSDSLTPSYEKMKQQLPDIFIHDFVDYIDKLPALPPISAKHQSEWIKQNWIMTDQKRHVQGWLLGQMDHGGEISYHRDHLNISLRTSYNRWNFPDMAIWLLEALGEDPGLIERVDHEAYNEPNKMKRAGLVRKYFPFERVLELLSNDPDGEKIIIRDEKKMKKRAKVIERRHDITMIPPAERS